MRFNRRDEHKHTRTNDAHTQWAAFHEVKPAQKKKTMAQDIHALALSLGYHRETVVGHDIGLMVAYAYAAQYPNDSLPTRCSSGT